MANLEKMVEDLSSLTVLEASELSKMLEERWGVSAAAVAAPVAVAGGQEEPAEEKDSFNVILKAVGDKKISVIKEVRVITGLGLKDAKDMVEAAPKEIKADVAKEEARELKKKLEAVGAEVELQ